MPDQVAFFGSPDSGVCAAFVNVDMRCTVPSDAGHRVMVIKPLAQVAGLTDIDRESLAGSIPGEDVVAWDFLEICADGIDLVGVLLAGGPRPVLLSSGGSHVFTFDGIVGGTPLTQPPFRQRLDLISILVAQFHWLVEANRVSALAVDSTKGPGIEQYRGFLYGN